MGVTALIYEVLVLRHRLRVRSLLGKSGGIVLAGAIICSGCGTGSSDWRQEQLHWPLKEFTWSPKANRLAISAASGVELEALAKVSLFAGFRPGVPIESVTADRGQPERTRTDFAGTYYEYSGPNARIEVAFEHSSSDVLGASRFTMWSVYAYPHDPSLSGIFHPAIVEVIRRTMPRDMVIMTSSGNWLGAELGGAQVSRLRYYRVQADGAVNDHPNALAN